MQKLKKEDLLKFKNEDEKNCINFNINEFMDLVYQYDLYEYTNDIYDENAMMDEMKKIWNSMVGLMLEIWLLIFMM